MIEIGTLIFCMLQPKFDFYLHRLTLSEIMGDTVLQYAKEKPKSAGQCLAVAQHIYISLHLHRPAIKCMVIQGKIKQALQYAQHRANYSVSDFAELLWAYPTKELSLALVGYKVGRSVIPIGVVATALLKSGHEDLAMQLMEYNCKRDLSSEYLLCNLQSDIRVAS